MRQTCSRHFVATRLSTVNHAAVAAGCLNALGHVRVPRTGGAHAIDLQAFDFLDLLRNVSNLSEGLRARLRHAKAHVTLVWTMDWAQAPCYSKLSGPNVCATGVVGLPAGLQLDSAGDFCTLARQGADLQPRMPI